MTRIINIAGNSGSGKTTLALNLGISLAVRGRDTLLIDGNIYSPDIKHYVDVSPHAYLNEFLNDEKKIEDTIILHPSGIKLILSMPEEQHDKKKHQKLNGALVSLIGKHEIILVDSFSLHPALFNIMDKTDETIFIANDDFASIAKAKDMIERMEKKGMNVVGIVLNKRRKDSVIKYIETVIEKPVIIDLPHDEKVIESINLRKPVYLTHPKSEFSKSISQLAELIDIHK